MEEIELRELIEILIKRKKTIAIITLISVAMATIFSFVVLKPTYEARMVLMASELANENQNGMEVAKIDEMLNLMSQYPTMNLETYRQQIKSPEVISKTIEELGLEDEYTVEGLAQKIDLEIIKDTQLITIKKTSGDPEKAALIVNTLGKNFINFVTEQAKDRAAKTFEYVEAQMEVEKSQYEEALLEFKELLSQPRGAQELNLELESSFTQITEYKSTLNDLEVKKDGLIKAIEKGTSYSNNRGSVVARPNLGESFNISFDDSNKVSAIDLAETEGRIESLNKQIVDLQNHIEELQVEYQDKQYKEDVVKQKVDINKKTYESFVSKYEELRVAETAKVGELSINVISSAFPPTRPVGPRKALNVAISLVLGLMVGVFVAFFAEYWESGDKNKHLNGGENIVN